MTQALLKAKLALHYRALNDDELEYTLLVFANATDVEETELHDGIGTRFDMLNVLVCTLRRCGPKSRIVVKVSPEKEIELSPRTVEQLYARELEPQDLLI